MPYARIIHCQFLFFFSYHMLIFIVSHLCLLLVRYKPNFEIFAYLSLTNGDSSRFYIPRSHTRRQGILAWGQITKLACTSVPSALQTDFSGIRLYLLGSYNNSILSLHIYFPEWNLLCQRLPPNSDNIQHNQHFVALFVVGAGWSSH